jgi:hypothetical protein
MAQQRIAKRRHRIRNAKQISNVIIEEMSKFGRDLLEKLIMSFLKRIELCINAK